MKQILVIAEIFQNRIMPVTFELAGAALEIACLKTQMEYCGEESVFVKGIFDTISGCSGKNRFENNCKEEIYNNYEHNCKVTRFDEKFRQIWNFAGEMIDSIKIAVPGDDPVLLAEKIAEHTAMDVIPLKISSFESYNSDAYKASLYNLISKMDVSHVLAAHTSQGRDFAPGLSLKLDAVFISGVNSVSAGNRESESVSAYEPMHDTDTDPIFLHKHVYSRKPDTSGDKSNGRLEEKIYVGKLYLYSRFVFENAFNMIIGVASDLSVVLTVMPGMFKFIRRGLSGKNRGNQLNIPQETKFSEQDSALPRIVHQGIFRKGSENKALKEAKVIVAAGRGIGERNQLGMIFKFAAGFSCSAVGVSRPLVDMGWIGYEHQIGITGAKVTPKLYIACGISGSAQHLAGMENSGIIVSINKNPHAPIFRYSDFCIKADIVEFIDEFLKQMEKINP